ncbi:MAG: hypothetical protein V7K40_14580 [Nostoc sp.]
MLAEVVVSNIKVFDQVWDCYFTGTLPANERSQGQKYVNFA